MLQQVKQNSLLLKLFMVNVRTQNKESRNCTVNVLPMGAGAVDLFAKAGHHCCHCWSEKKARFQSFQPETTS